MVRGVELATLDNASIKLLISELVKLDQMYDVVIIDTGAGITDSVMEFVMMSPEVVLVVTRTDIHYRFLLIA